MYEAAVPFSVGSRSLRVKLGPTLISFPSAAQEARNKFEEVERSLKEMEESIRYGCHRCLSCPVIVYHQLLGGGASLVPAGPEVQPYLPTMQLGPPSLCLGPSVLGSHGLPTFTTLTCFSRSLEQEISFDFGPSGEFAYLYSQCYELTTNEYILALEGWAWDQGGKCGGGHWTDKNPWLLSVPCH